MTGSGEFSIGQQASRTKTVTESDVETFAELIGDFNPIHMDAEFARIAESGIRVARCG